MRRRMTAEERRKQIIQGAMKVFAKKGFRGTTTREIARILGISEALMFRYFPTKRDLYWAIIKNRMDGAENMLFPTDAIHLKDDREVFKSIASYLIKRNTEDPTFMRLILYSALESHELSRIFFENITVEKTALLSRYIKWRIDEGSFKDVNPVIAARAFIGMIVNYVQSMEIYKMKDLLGYSHNEVVETLVEIFLNGLKEERYKNGRG
jgi:AcrR family transcriptional regulator